MNTLDLGYVNRLAPYKVWTENGMDFYIETDFGNLFKVGFMNDSSIWESGAYQFTINNEHNRPSPNDSKLKNTLYRLVEAFFEANPDIFYISVKQEMTSNALEIDCLSDGLIIIAVVMNLY